MTYHQNGAPHLGKAQIHFALLVLKYPQITDLFRQLVTHCLGILGPYAQQDKIALINGAPHRPVDGDGGGGHPGNDGSHKISPFAL